MIAGLEAARAAGLTPVKVNAVLLRGVNDDQAPELLRWAVAEGYELRFIEQMPLDAQHDWSRAEMVTAEEIFESLGREFTLTPAVEPRGSAPAELFIVDGGPATVGVIASVTRPFCGDCDRVRLTADGQVRNCLFAREESDLRAPLRAGATDDEIAAALGGRDARQAGRPRHRRPDVPAARPADVGHRRLAGTRASGSAAQLRRPLVLRPLRDRHDVAQELTRGQEVRRASSGARRTPARPCVGPACAACGLFQSSAQTASAWQPLALQTRWLLGMVIASIGRSASPEMARCRTAHGGGRPAPW